MARDASLDEFVGDDATGPESDAPSDGEARSESADQNEATFAGAENDVAADADGSEATDADGGEAADVDGSEATDVDDGEATDVAGDETTTASAATSRWRPSPQSCDRCEESVERLWATDDGFVCAACATW